MLPVCFINRQAGRWYHYSDTNACGESAASQKSKKEGKDQESIQSSTTPDPGYQWESDNVTIRHHKRKPRALSQQVTTY